MLLEVIVVTLFAGLTMPLGAVIAHIEKFETKIFADEFGHSVMAFGGGALLSAVALVLVPEGVEGLSPAIALMCFFAGGISFMMLDIYLSKNSTPASQLAVMLADFIPESLGLGATFLSGSANAYLFAILIGLQNLPEGYNAFRELAGSRLYQPRKIIAMFSMMALLGPLAGIAGYFWLSKDTAIISVIMLFAAGGILYSVFQDIAPNVKLARHYGPPLGALLGFSVGMVGYMMAAGG